MRRLDEIREEVAEMEAAGQVAARRARDSGRRSRRPDEIEEGDDRVGTAEPVEPVEPVEPPCT